MLFRESNNLHSTKLLGHYFLIKVDLFCRGRGIFDSAKTEYMLHKAVFENNLPLISRLIKCAHEGIFYAEKNELDSGGNTPLILAVKLGNVDAVKVLTDLFTCPKLKSFNNCKSFPMTLDSSVCNRCSQWNKEQGYHQNPFRSQSQDQVALLGLA